MNKQWVLIFRIHIEWNVYRNNIYQRNLQTTSTRHFIRYPVITKSHITYRNNIRKQHLIIKLAFDYYRVITKVTTKGQLYLYIYVYSFFVYMHSHISNVSKESLYPCRVRLLTNRYDNITTTTRCHRRGFFSSGEW